MSSACVNTMTISTANHLWSLDDVLGQGATASVYKARNKKTGELVAVKVFNLVSYNRPYEVQMREFEVLQKLNHVNIVKLFAVEKMHMNPKQKVLVMEFCSGGSLLNLLEEPENAFGLPESEFLIVLHCVVQGMNHLRENGVVHRDIKPGNIMRQVGEDGRSVYKLTDFGAARELEDDEKFVSIYGTEEYLKIQHVQLLIRNVHRGLKTQLVPVLASILEANQEKCWGFVQFFVATTDILHCITVHIFSLQQATAHNIYIHFHNTVSILFEDVQAQTGIELAAQQYLFLGHPLILEPSMKVVNLPLTTPDRPIILISRRPEKLVGHPYKEPEAPAMPTKFDVMADYTFSKTIVGVIHQYLRIACSLQKYRELIQQGFYSYIENTGFECSNVAHRIAMVNMKLLSSISTEEHLHLFAQRFAHEFPDFVDNKKKLPLIEEDLQRMYGSGVREFQNQLQHLHVMLSKHSETLAQDKSIQKMEVLLGKIVAVHQQYCKDRMTGKLSYNDEQIHKFEKLNLSLYIKKVKSLFKDDCLQKYQDVLMAAGSWNRVLYEMQASLEHFGVVLRQRMGDLHVCEAQQNKVLDRAVLRALQQPVGAEGVDGQKKDDEHMILKMNRLKDEMEAVARELQNNNNMIESLAVVTATLPLEKKVPQANGP
ncbi:inhibitor of nuclear factor kappa-B kinase subunit epsilon-like [Sinocyclocheilus anshuiensis]|uniref:inhibitor of nuclear factor kappa-B kinase subunit epsilon-like n=1 Tax=Sinocyclocheilus anshuiensis TaxID=1608454 RepID=UPI0007BA7102|nr:PREDICTED: inhibitor of nuclear factor kappa-B kinase subunit epsilon-like [Sinocyclocheilus anshuiensis]